MPRYVRQGHSASLWECRRGNEYLCEFYRLSVWLPNPLKWLHALHPSPSPVPCNPRIKKKKKWDYAIGRKWKWKNKPAHGRFLMTYLFLCARVCGFLGNFDQLTRDGVSNWGQNCIWFLQQLHSTWSEVVSALIVRVGLVIGVRVRLTILGGNVSQCLEGMLNHKCVCMCVLSCTLSCWSPFARVFLFQFCF